MRIRIVICMMLLAGVALAQGTKTGAAKSAPQPAPKVKKAVPAAITAPATVEVTQELVETFLKRVYGWNLEISFKVTELRKSEAAGITDAVVIASTTQGQQLIHFYVTPDGGHVIMGDLVPFGSDPFAPQRELLNRENFGPTKGPKDARLTVVEFADLECPACKAAQPEVEKLQKDFPQVKFVFQSFPLDQLHPWANQAARDLDCLQRENNDQALSFLETVFIHQADVTPENSKEKLDKYLGMVGADPAKIAVCAESPETKQRIARSQDLGHQVKITGTPSLFVNGHPAVLSDYEHLKSLLEYELAQANSAK